MNKKLLVLSLMSLLTLFSCNKESIQDTNNPSDKFVIKQANLKYEPEGKNIVLFDDKVKKHKLTAILLNPESKSFNTKDITFSFGKGKDNYCRIFLLKSEGPYSGEKDYDEYCRPQFTIYGNDSFLAAIPIHIPKKAEVYYYEVYEPCDVACQKPLTVKVVKTPGSVCKNGVKENGSIVYERNTEEKTFLYNECKVSNFPKDLEIYSENDANNLLKNAEPRLQDIEAKVDKLVAETEAKYPQFGKFTDNK